MEVRQSSYQHPESKGILEVSHSFMAFPHGMGLSLGQHVPTATVPRSTHQMARYFRAYGTLPSGTGLPVLADMLGGPD
ncbi:hypothetical protein PG984_006548 [Apiospora sp. TS-2023a]